jgi:multiple sugar transport system substrate-binding protein
VPKGPSAQAAPTTGDGIGVVEASTKKEAAYLYCQWAISKEMGARLLQSGSGVPFRNSILNDEAVRQGVKMPAGWVDAIAQSAPISQLTLPVIIPVTEFRDIMGVGLTNLLGGADAATEMKRATEEFRPVLERSEA